MRQNAALCGNGLSAFAEEKLNVAQVAGLASHSLENFVCKRRKCRSTAFSSFAHKVFKSVYCQKCYHLTLSQIKKILDLSKFKAFADDNLTVNQKLKFALERAENIVGKGENAYYQHFLLFP